MMLDRRRRLAALTVAAAAVTVAACSSGDDGDEGDGGDGIVVEIFAPYRTTEADSFTASLGRFTDRTGIEIAYVGSADFIDDLRRRTVSADPPDIAIVPQPALVDELLEEGALVALSEQTSDIVAGQSNIATQAAPDAHTDYGVPFRTTVKSLVWFRPDVFAANDWAVPTTLDGLAALVDEISAADDGTAPWCFGIRSGAATGWPATDWVEDLLLRTGGVDAYERLAAGEFHEIDDELTQALDLFHEIVGETDVVGGRGSALTTDVSAAVGPLFTGGCALLKQADFALSWMPDGTTVGADDDVAAFVLPGVTADEPPIVVGGDTAVQFSDDPAVHEVMTFLASADGASDWATAGGYLSSRTDVEPESYFHPNSYELLGLIGDAEVTRFDASDQLPVEFTLGTYQPSLTRWVAGSLDTATLVDGLADISRQAADDAAEDGDA